MKNFINSYDRVKNAIESGKARNIFNLVDGDFLGMGDFEYSPEATIVLELVAKNGEGFVVDICNRVLSSIENGKAIILSEKQRWCVAFAAAKLPAEAVRELREMNDARIAELESETMEADAAPAAEETETTFAVLSVCGNGDTAVLFENGNEDEARSRFFKEAETAGEPVDVVGWTDGDRGWGSLYRIELMRTVTDEYGEITDMEVIRTSEYYRI